MSPRRRILLLSLIAGALSATYVAGLLVSRPPRPVIVVHHFETSVVDRVEAGPVRLRRTDGLRWEVSIGGDWFPADPSKVERMLTTLSGLTAGRIASTERRDWSSFKVGQGQAARLDVKAGGRTVVDLYVGESSSSGGVYVREASTSAVYEVEGVVADYVSGGAEYWSYLRILPRSLRVDSLQTISISAHGFEAGGVRVDQSYLLVSSVVKGENEWVARGRLSANLDQQKVLSLEAEIVRMVGDSFVVAKSGAGTGLDRPLATIALSDQQGDTWTLLVGKRHGAQFYVKRRDLPYVYLVNEWTLHRCLPRLSDLTTTK